MRGTSGSARRSRTPKASRARAWLSVRAPRRLREPRRRIRPARRIYISVDPRSGGAAVVVVHRHLLELEILQTTNVDGRGGHAFRIGALAKRQNAAVLAEAVFDDVLVEGVGRKFRFARELHLLARHEPQQRAALRADGAVAGYGAGDLAFHFDGHLAAMTAAAIFHVRCSRVREGWRHARAASGRPLCATRTMYGHRASLSRRQAV